MTTLPYVYGREIMSQKMFDSEYKPVKFVGEKEVLLSKDYGYAPLILVHYDNNGVIEYDLPRFAIVQSYIDKYHTTHYYTDRFILFTEAHYPTGTFYYQVFGYNNEVLEKGRIP